MNAQVTLMEEEFETEIKSISVKRQDTGIAFVVVNNNDEEQIDTDFEELLQKYPKKVCRALIKEVFPWLIFRKCDISNLKSFIVYLEDSIIDS